MMSGSEIAVAFGLDAGYAPHAGAAIASIVAAAPQRAFHFIMIHDRVPGALQAMVQQCAPHARFSWLVPPEGMLSRAAATGHVSRATYARFAIPDLVRDWSRVVYLDCDLVVQADLEPLYHSELGGTALGAVTDHWIDPAAFAQTWGLVPAQARYFNAGVLVLDLARLREHGGFARAVVALGAHGAAMPFMDQDALNLAFWGEWQPLDRSWNVQRAALMPGFEAAAQASAGPERGIPKIVHFTGAEKPWRRGAYHPYAATYLRALARTPFWKTVMQANGPLWHERLRAYINWARKAALFRS